MTNFYEIKKSNDKLLNEFGKSFDVQFIPECVNEDFNVIEKKLRNIKDDADPIELINDLIYSYGILNESRKNNFPNSKYISNGFSNIILLRDNIVNEDGYCMSAIPALAHINRSYEKFSSPATFVINKAYELYLKTEDQDIKSKIFDSVNSLIATIIEYFDPKIVSTFLSGIYNVYAFDNESDFKELFSYDKMKNYFETLINHENIAYANEYVDFMESVGYAYFYNIFCFEKSSIDVARKILDKGSELKEVLSLSNKIPFKYFKEKAITLMFTECVLSGSSIRRSSEKADILKRIRENITSWIKHKDLSERPEVPEYFEFIDMGSFIHKIYDFGIYNLGNIEKFVNDREKRISELENKISNSKKENNDNKNDSKAGVDKQELKALADVALNTAADEQELKLLKDEYMGYLRIKSSISFLIEECTANEKIATMVFKPEIAVSMILREPDIDNAMHDTHTCIGSLFIKRDFRPLGSAPINPYYVHYCNNDVDQSSNEALFMSDVLSLCANPFNRSLISTAGIKDMFSLSTSIASMKMNVFESRNTIKYKLDSIKSRLDNFISAKEDIKESSLKIIEMFSCISDLKEMVNKDDGIELNLLSNANSKLKEFTESIKDEDKDALTSSIYEFMLDLNQYIDWYISYVGKVENFLGEFKYIVSHANGEDQDCNNSASISVNENKPLKNFWPITQQYEFEIEEDPVLEDATDPYRDVKPGDIYHHRYGSRYKASKNCD